VSNILDDIIAKRRQTVKELKNTVPVHSWQSMPLFKKENRSLKRNLENGNLTGIIAEFKRASPSKGIINDKAGVLDVVSAYEKNGAAGLSILTEPYFFNGNNVDNSNVVSSQNTPILRKDFIIDEYQLVESKGIGADVILLIAACLDPKEVKNLAAAAKNLGLEVLLEIHNEKELDHICDEVDMVGVNNRNLKTFGVDIENSLQLINKIPTNKPAIAESGISDAETIVTLREAGFKGFLIGETFMKETDPAIAFANFVKQLKAKANE
jgi:indole-3-glycerol phosphate synthase